MICERDGAFRLAGDLEQSGHLGGAFGASRNTAMMVAAVAKLGRAFAAQVEALRRLKNGGSQSCGLNTFTSMTEEKQSSEMSPKAGVLDHARCRTIRTIKIRMTAPMNPAIK